jgi:hypothetical protein
LLGEHCSVGELKKISKKIVGSGQNLSGSATHSSLGELCSRRKLKLSIQFAGRTAKNRTQFFKI